ncbi:MAG: VTT domain-containing protein [Megasphaera sp.]|jgi:uncharacterized membrane protein YdjX (TVP38/TMEM64 family)|nr:VTT domain-containing protein [Megasphaera sp.]MCH4188073.1 VTT domain-containing protein [Megasphaera sp.]MCH4218543.1 VTT domain-containing protein [Megasphaera sp.]
MKSSSLDALLKLAVLVIIVLELGAIQVFIPDFYGTIVTLTVDGDIDGLTEYLSSFGYWAILISIFMIVITNVTGLPSIPFLTVNGVIFGLVPGIIISWIGEVIGIEGGFIIMRTVLRDKARKLIEKNNMLGKLETYSTIKNMAMCRAIPYSPNVVFTALGAMSKMSFRDHTVATLAGKIPSVIFEVWLGHDLLRFSKYGGRFIVIATLVLTIYYCYHQYRKNRR